MVVSLPTLHETCFTCGYITNCILIKFLFNQFQFKYILIEICDNFMFYQFFHFYKNDYLVKPKTDHDKLILEQNYIFSIIKNPNFHNYLFFISNLNSSKIILFI